MNEYAWNYQDCLTMFTPQVMQTTTQRKRKSAYSTEDLKSAYSVIAGLVNEYGEIYLPIFERIHAELEARKQKDELLRMAKCISPKNLSTEFRIANPSQYF